MPSPLVFLALQRHIAPCRPPDVIPIGTLRPGLLLHAEYNFDKACQSKQSAYRRLVFNEPSAWAKPSIVGKSLPAEREMSILSVYQNRVYPILQLVLFFATH